MIKLALGGGGITGICHVGVVEALKDNNVEVSAIVGTSAGALFGSIYTSMLEDTNGDIDKVIMNLKHAVIETDFTDFQDSNWLQRWIALFTGKAEYFGLYKGDALLKWLMKQTKNKRFKDISLNLMITATEMSSGKLIVFSKENTPDIPIAIAARASSSLQGYYVPFRLAAESLSNAIYKDNDISGDKLKPSEVKQLAKDGYIYMWDGGNLGNCRNDIMLSTPPKSYPTLGVSLTYSGMPVEVSITDIILQTVNIMMMATEKVIDELSEYRGVKDLFVYPDTFGIQTTDFDISDKKKKKLMNSGYESAVKGLKELGF